MSAELIEDYDWESDESEDWESDEAFAESEDSVEDIGERARRRKRQAIRTSPARARISGVQGVRVSGPSGTQSLRFPAKLATAAETNRGLASQERARLEIERRLTRVEATYRARHTKDASMAGLVTLGIGGGLTAFGAMKTAGEGGGLAEWAKRDSTKTAAVVSASQLATSGARLLIHKKYAASPIPVTSDIFAVLQLAMFAFGSLRKDSRARISETRDAALEDAARTRPPVGTLYLVENDVLRVVYDTNNKTHLVGV